MNHHHRQQQQSPSSTSSVPDFWEATAEAARAGLSLDVHHRHGFPVLWQLFDGSRLVLTWTPQLQRATLPRPEPSVECRSWRDALWLASQEQRPS
jgi:hypothetical protein